MSSERISEISSSVEEKRGDPEYLERAIYFLSRELLYSQLPQEVEIEGYSALRSLTNHPDKQVRMQADKTLEKRWVKVGFYERIEPRKDLELSFFLKRPWYQEEESMGTPVLYENSKVAVLVLARAYERGEELDRKKLEGVLFPLLGTKTNIEGVLERIQNVYMLTDEASFRPVVEFDEEKVSLTPDAYEIVKAHLPVLEAISFPEYAIPPEEVSVLARVKKTIRGVQQVALEKWSNKGYGALTYPEQHLGFFPHLSYIEVKSRLGFEKEAYRVLPLLTDGGLFLLSRSIAGSIFGEGVNISAHRFPGDVKNQLVVNFWGDILRGDLIGNLSFGRTITAEGIFRPSLPKGLENSDSVEISEDKIRFIHNDVFGQNKRIYLDPTYCGVISSDGQDRETYVSANLYSLQVPATRERKKESPPDTLNHEILLDKPEDEISISHPKGDYKVQYERKGETLFVNIKVDGWSSSFVIPTKIDPVAITEEVSEKLESFLEQVDEKRDTISTQLGNIYRLGLAEQGAIRLVRGNLPAGLDDPMLLAEEFKSVLESPRLQLLQEIDNEIENLGEFEQWAVKTYIAVLLSQEPTEEAEAPQDKMRKLVSEHQLDIPYSLLEMIDEAFPFE